MAGGYKPQWQWSTLGGDWSGLRAAIHSVRFPGQTAGVVSVKSRRVRSTEQVAASDQPTLRSSWRVRKALRGQVQQ